MKYSVETPRGTMIYDDVREAMIAFGDACEDKKLKWVRIVAIEAADRVRVVSEYKRGG